MNPRGMYIPTSSFCPQYKLHVLFLYTEPFASMLFCCLDQSPSWSTQTTVKKDLNFSGIHEKGDIIISSMPEELDVCFLKNKTIREVSELIVRREFLSSSIDSSEKLFS